MDRMNHADNSKAAVRAFLRTVVVIDDNADTGRLDHSTVEALSKPAQVTGPIVGKESRAELDEHRAPEAQGDSPTGAPAEKAYHQLDVQRLQDSLADSGLIGSILIGKKPAQGEETERWLTRVKTLAARSDAIVLDWSWHGDAGEFCATLIDALLGADGRSRHQLAVIYTGQTDSEEFGDRLKGLRPEETEPERLRFSWPSKGLHVAVLQKGGAPGEPFYDGSKVDETQLPNRLYDIFAETTSGLLGNAVMHALAMLRDHTHSILYRFHRELDPAFVVNRACAPPRGEVDAHVAELLADSVYDVMRSAPREARLGDDQIAHWLAHQGANSLLKDAGKYLSIAEDASLSLTRGEVTRAGGKRKGMIELTKLLARFSSDDDAEDLHWRLAALMLASEGSSVGAPKLGNGVVLRCEKTGAHYLCVMPLCDSERVSQQGANFAFLAAQDFCPGRSGGFTFALRDGAGSLQRLWVLPKVDNLALKKFASVEGAEPVLGVKSEATAWRFTDTDGANYGFSGRLRPLIAHEVSRSLGASVSRIGLMKPALLQAGERH